LHPNPGDLITNKQPEYIVPDVMVIKKQNLWQVSLAKDFRENLRINTDYSRLIKSNNNARDAEYLRTQLSEAKWLLNGIQNRNNTLLKVASSIVKCQRDFLERGDEYMRPMVLQDIALETGFNESTISRVTTKKYIHTPRGIFELKYFFSGHLTNITGNDCSSIAIKAIIKQLISKEVVQTPLSDQAISALMQNQGLKVARRTIAKYRESLGIGSSSQRKNK
jgi:RNA polymerase sigma-54 factor